MTRVWARNCNVLAGVLIFVLALFARDVGDMADQWWNSSTYGHCLFILPLVAWLIWQRRHEIVQVEPRAWVPGLGVLGLAAFIWLLGEAAGIALVRHAAVIGMVQASMLTIIGPAAFRALLFPIFYLVFLIPFGGEFVAPLQTLTAKMATDLLHLAQVPAQIDGVFITTPSGWFEVAEACAGVEFLVAMVAFGALGANVCFKSWRRRASFMILCIAAPVIANGIRAFATIYAAHLTDVQTATGFDHIVYGWFFFAFVMIVVFAIGWRFFDRKIGDAWLDTIPQAFGPDRPVVLTALAAIGVALLPLLWNGSVGAAGQRPLPHAVGLPPVAGWTIVPITGGYPWVPRFDGADHALLGRYRDVAGHTVDLGIALYGWQADGRKIVGFGQGVDRRWSWAADTPGPAGAKAAQIRAPGKIVRETMTFYVLGGSATGDAMTVKLRTLKSRIVGGDQSATVFVISAKGTQARTAINRFLVTMGPVDRQANALIAAAQGR